MHKIIVGLACVLAACITYSAQDSSLTIRMVRDPVQLREKLNANALDAQTRVAVLENSIGTNSASAAVTVGGLTVTTLATAGALTTTGAVTIAEGKLTDSTVVSADIKDATIVDADVAAAAAIAQSKIAVSPLGATTITLTDGASWTNYLYFSAQGTLTNAVAIP